MHLPLITGNPSCNEDTPTSTQLTEAAGAEASGASSSGAGSKASGREGGGRGLGAGQVEGPLQLSSTAQAWKDGLGDADVGKWDLIYRYAYKILEVLPISWAQTGEKGSEPLISDLG